MAKGLKAKDLRGKTDAELATLAASTRDGLLEARFQNHTNQLNDTAKISRLRRELARIQLVTKERSASKAATKAPAKAEG